MVLNLSRKSQGKPICAASTISLHIPSFKYLVDLVGAYGSTERPTLPSLPLNDGRLCLKKCPAQSRRSGSNPQQRSEWLVKHQASSGTTLTTLTTIYGRFKYRENQEAAEGNSLCLSNLFRLEGLILRFVILSNFIHAKIPPHLHPDPSKRRGIA